MKLTDIKGIGVATAAKLIDADILTISDIAEDENFVETATGLGIRKADEILENAKKLLATLPALPQTPTLPEGVRVIGHRWAKMAMRKVSYKGITYQLTGHAHSAQVCRANVLNDEGEYVPEVNMQILAELYRNFKMC